MFKQILKSCALSLVIFLLLLEGASYLYILFVNPNIPLPTYRVIDASNRFWCDIDEHFGVWHQPHATYLHNKACFTAIYTANAYGMRDKARDKHAAAPRAVILGDSFVEGWGIADGERLSDVLEERLQAEVLNFGTSGGFGTIQEWLQYKHLVKQFEHDVVILGVLPHNDFKDNSLEIDELIDSKHYKPYLVGTYPDYKLHYRFDKLPEQTSAQSFLRSIDFTIREWSACYRILRYLGSFRIKDMQLVPRWELEYGADPTRHSMYHQFAERDWDIMKYAIEQLVGEAGHRKVLIFTIPVYSDFLKYDGAEPPLSRRFRQLAQQHGFVYVDLLAELARRHVTAHDLFFVCDNHWNPYANRVVADILLPYVQRCLTPNR